MATFKITKKGINNFWHTYNNNSKVVNLSDFEVVLDNASQTFSISMPNGSNVPNIAVAVADIIVLDETGANVNETFVNVEQLRQRLVVLGYTPYLDFVTPSPPTVIYKVGQVAVFTMTNTEFIDNFTDTGLGINTMLGWALRNEQNGTKNQQGKFSLNKGASPYDVIGASGGSANAVVVEHSHNMLDSRNVLYSGGTATGIKTGSDFVTGTINKTSSFGESGLGKNMPPYLIDVWVERVTELIINSGSGGGGGGGDTNLGYIPSPTIGVVTSSTGSGANIPLADGTNSGLFSSAQKTKLDGIEAGAEVNVNADWNATSGDAQILNKPTIPSAQNLNEVLTVNNVTSGKNISISNGDAVILDNGAKLIKGTTDAGVGGSKGIALRCTAYYELKWEAGRLYVMEENGITIREVSYNFAFTPTATDDNTKGFVIGSRWILDDGDVYVCTDATTATAVWELQSSGSQNLQQVTDGVGNNVTTNDIQINELKLTDSIQLTIPSISIQDNIFYAKTQIGEVIFGADLYNQIFFRNQVANALSIIRNTNITATRIYDLPDAGGTLALTTDVTNILIDTITDGDTTHAPDGNSVFDALATKEPTITAGTTSQYWRGDKTWQTLPSNASGGNTVNYYLNGSVAASVATYKQMSNTASVGTGTDFSITGNGLIAQFLTDVGNPNRLEIPGGAWNFEMFFSMSSGGGSPKFYVELLKYDGATFTSIASSSAIPETISGGALIDLYLTSLAVPTTPLLVTDRLAVRVYIVNSSGGKTATLHTEDSHLCEIITTFAGGVTLLNGLTDNTQYFQVGTAGANFDIDSTTTPGTHIFILPDASATDRGVITTGAQTIAGVKTFSSNLKMPATGIARLLQVEADGKISGLDLLVYPSLAELETVKGITTGVTIQSQLNGKQATLIWEGGSGAGQNIKTVAGVSLIGPGNVSITTSFTTRQNANNSSNPNINYCGVALGQNIPTTNTAWTIKKLTISAAGVPVVTTTTVPVKWVDREAGTTIYS